jgi:predicted aspartyl protease
MKPCCALAFLFGLLVATAAGAQGWIPIEVREGLLTFAARVEGEETRAALNTSAPFSSVDAAFAARVGLGLSGKRQRVASAGGSRVVASEAELEVELFGERVVLRDTPALHHPDTPLLLGAAFLEPFVLQIDYPGSRMRIVARDALPLRERANVPMRAAEGSCSRRGRDLSGDVGAGVSDFARYGFPGLGGARGETPCLPAVKVEFAGGKKAWLLLDTGAAGPLVVSRLFAKRAGWLDSYRRGSQQVADVFGATTTVDMLVLPSVKLGPYELGDVPVAVPAEGERALAPEQTTDRVETGTHVTRGARASGRIGYDALRHFVVTIDLQRKLLQVAQPAKEAAR